MIQNKFMNSIEYIKYYDLPQNLRKLLRGGVAHFTLRRPHFTLRALRTLRGLAPKGLRAQSLARPLRAGCVLKPFARSGTSGFW